MSGSRGYRGNGGNRKEASSSVGGREDKRAEGFGAGIL